MSPRRFVLGLPANAVNGIGAALGIALIQWLVGSTAGWTAALTASGGAILASLADVPNAPHRTWRRVLTAALIGSVTSMLLSALRAWPFAVGTATVVLAFLSALTLAWGLRAGPISFVAILALVFTMAAPPEHGLDAWLVHSGWTVLGAGLYVGWAMLASVRLQPRYRTLALADALDALAGLLRSRSLLLSDEPLFMPASPPLQEWIERQVALDERLQAARDLLFAAAGRALEQRLVGVLLAAIDLRDTLLASELDIDLLGRDAATSRLRMTLVEDLDRSAAAIDRTAEALRFANDPEQAGGAAAADGAAATLGQAPMAVALQERASHMADDLAKMQAALRGVGPRPTFSRDELQLFVSPEGWPLSALGSHATLASPVLRHALRTGVALGCAYFIALALPWASHPHWLVLSVAVVLRGNLEQTLARRDARVAGTVLGCVLMLALTRLDAAWLSILMFLVAVAAAHAFVVSRYLVTATAATVMALLQSHFADPSGGFDVGERLADTVLGALLAWGFSYMLPSWERRGLERLVERVQSSLRRLADEALHWPDPAASDLQLRLARRDVYDAIGGIAAMAQRTGAEPERVRVPLYALATLLTRCHGLLAQLTAVRMVLTRHHDRLEPGPARKALQVAAAELRQTLSSHAGSGLDADLPLALADAASRAATFAEGLQPWLERRLRLATLAAARVAQAAAGVRSAGA